MARALRDEQLTPADEVRELLTLNEKRVANLSGSREEVLELLRDMDRIAELWPKLEARGMDLRAEAGRWETLTAALQRQAKIAVAELNAIGGAATVRVREHGDRPVAWWWRLDEMVRRERIRRIRTAILSSLTAIALIAALIFAFNAVFPVDPQLRTAMRHQSEGQKLVERGDLAGAVIEFQAAANALPTDPDPWLWLGAVYEKMGDTAAAQANWERARERFPNEISFRQARVAVYLATNMAERARPDLDFILALDPDEPSTLYYLASWYETQGALIEAANALERAARSAEARQQVELTAMARYRLAMVLQQIQIQSLKQPTASPTP